LGRERENLGFWAGRLEANNPMVLFEKIKNQLKQINNNILKSFIIYNKSKQMRIRELSAKLEALSPVAILARGYSITRTIPEAEVVRDARTVSLNQDLEVMIAKGRLFCRVKGKSTNGEKDI
ncbi:MAG: hypothetical protein KJO34_13415, partial [Deltaproteobacteria bacterium]|nr:hypothetical protein [Deltaproteobacteria bacterium]